MPKDLPSDEKGCTPVPHIPREEYFASPERQETYRRICEFTRTKERISESMIEEEFELSYCTTMLATMRMQDEGLISQEHDEDYMFRVL